MRHRMAATIAATSRRLAALLVGGVLLLAQPGPSAAADGSLSPEAVVLENGLTLVVVANPQMPAVAHYVFYKVGSIDEPWGKSGIAHFLEHLMFKGTTRDRKSVV